MRYVVNYVAGYGEHGRYYCTIKDGETPEAAGEAVIAEKLAAPSSFDWVEVTKVETVEEHHAG